MTKLPPAFVSRARSLASGANGSSRNVCPVWRMNHETGARPFFPPEVVVQVKALACELPAQTDLPLSRFSRQDFRTPDIGTKSRCVVFRSFDPENAIRVRGFCQCDALHTQRLVTHSRRTTSQYFEETIGMSGGLKVPFVVGSDGVAVKGRGQRRRQYPVARAGADR